MVATPRENERNRTSATGTPLPPCSSLQASTLGAVMSLCAVFVMTVLFVSESYAFAKTSLGTEIALDDNSQQQIRLNFNLTP